MKKVVAAMMLLFVVGSANLFAVNLSGSEVSTRSVLRLLSNKYDAKLDDDLILLKNNGINVGVRIDAERKLVRFLALFNDNKSRSALLNAANKFNNDKIIVRVFIDDENAAWLDHYIIYNGGLNSENLYKAMDWFVSICKDWQTRYNAL